MNYPYIHIGKHIEQIVEDKGWSKAKFAEKMNIQRQNIVKTIFEKENLNSDILRKASTILNVNLFKVFFTEDTSARIAQKDYVEHDKIVMSENNADFNEVLGLKDKCQQLQNAINQLRSQIKDKERIIQLYESRK